MSQRLADVAMVFALIAAYIAATRRTEGTVGETLKAKRYGGVHGRDRPVTSRR